MKNPEIFKIEGINDKMQKGLFNRQFRKTRILDLSDRQKYGPE